MACNFINKETLAQVFNCESCEISQNTFFTENLWASKEHSQTTGSAFLETVLYEHSSHLNLAKGTSDEMEVKGFSNQSRLHKNVSYHKVPGEDRRITFLQKSEIIAIGKNFHVKSDKK